MQAWVGARQGYYDRLLLMLLTHTTAGTFSNDAVSAEGLPTNLFRSKITARIMCVMCRLERIHCLHYSTIHVHT